MALHALQNKTKKKTLEDISNAVDRALANISGTRNARDGVLNANKANVK